MPPKRTPRRMCIIGCFLYLIAPVVCDVKTWMINTNFEDPANWNGNGVFCSNDRKGFPKDMTTSVFIQKNESLQELRLSNNMVLTIGEGASLSFTSTARLIAGEPLHPDLGSCSKKGRELKFMADADSWFNPDAWSSALLSNNDSQRFLLDVERVPCEKDNVIFPAQNSFMVNMEGQDLKVGSVTIRNQKLSGSAAFKKYWDSDSAKYEFHNVTSTSDVFGDSGCTEDKGICQCPSADQYREKLICEYVKMKAKQENVTQLCSQPRQPSNGLCLEFCGAVLYVRINDTDLAWNEFHQELAEIVSQSPTVKYALAGTSNIFEIVLKDNETGSIADDVACILYSHLQTNYSIHHYNIDRIDIERSDNTNSCPKPHTKRIENSNNGFGNYYIIIGISCAITVILILLIVMGVYLYKKKTQWQFQE